MRYRLCTAAAAIMIGFATPALACLPPPPPVWDAWLGNDTPIYLGRVESVTPKPPVDYGDIVRTDGIAEIRLVEVIQGHPVTESAQAVGVLSFSFRSPPAGPLCADYLDFKPGDLAIVVELPDRRAVFSRNRADAPALAPFFEKHQ